MRLTILLLALLLTACSTVRQGDTTPGRIVSSGDLRDSIKLMGVRVTETAFLDPSFIQPNVEAFRTFRPTLPTYTGEVYDCDDIAADAHVQFNRRYYAEKRTAAICKLAFSWDDPTRPAHVVNMALCTDNYFWVRDFKSSLFQRLDEFLLNPAINPASPVAF